MATPELRRSQGAAARSLLDALAPALRRRWSELIHDDRELDRFDPVELGQAAIDDPTAEPLRRHDAAVAALTRVRELVHAEAEQASDELRAGLAPFERAIDAAVRAITAADAGWAALEPLAVALAEAPTLAALVTQAASGAVRLVHAEAALVLLRHGRALALAAAAGRGGPLDGDLRVDVGDGFAGHLALGLEPRRSAVAANDPLGEWAAARGLRLQALFGVPLVASGVAEGVALVGTSRAYELGPRDEARFVALCRLLAPAVQRHQAVARAELRCLEQADAARDLELWRGEVMSVLAHDLRTPLSSIKVGAGALARDPGGSVDTMVRRTAEIIERSAVRMQRLIDDVADLAALRSGRSQIEVAARDPAALAEAVVAPLRGLAAHKGVRLELEVVATPPRVLCDAEKVARALGSLLDVALVSTPKDREVRVTVQARGDEVLFAVEDHGPGVAPEDLTSYFDERIVARAAGRRAAAGFALALARALVVGQGGRMWAASKLGAGTTAFFTLPVEKA